MTTPPRRKRTRGGTARPVPARVGDREPEPVNLDVVLDDSEEELAPQTERVPRAETAAIEDAQLVEVAELAPLARTTLAIHEIASEHVTAARTTATALGHRAIGGGTGAAAINRILTLLRDNASVQVVLVGLPGGEPIIDAARALAPRRPVVIAAVGGSATTAPDRAHAAGADLAALRPHDPERLGPVLMAAALLAAERGKLSALQGNETLLRSRLSRYDDVDTSTGLETFDVFKRQLELELKRSKRYGYALSVCQLALIRHDVAPPPPIQHELHLRAANAVRDAVRDIDFAVDLAEDRFLVLLPYTDTEGATLVARRLIEAVREAPAVRAGGRMWSPGVVAGVAGVVAGRPPSMATLMRDCGEAVRAALHRGVALVVAP